MLAFQYGGKEGKRYRLTVNKDLLVARTWTKRPLHAAAVSTPARRIVESMERIARFNEAGVELFRFRQDPKRRVPPAKARAILKRETDLRFAGRVLADSRSDAPVLYTENLFVKFHDDCSPRACRQLLRNSGLAIKRDLRYARNAYLVAAPEGSGWKVFNLALRLLRDEKVQFSHPELIRLVRRRRAFPEQWHLKKTAIGGNTIQAHAHVETAWALSEGAGTTIAIIDDGVDLNHEEFSSPGKIVAPRDVTRRTNDPRPGNGDDHGTACAGVACGDGEHGASGVAPKARLLPIRLVSGLGSQAEADAIVWAAQHGADVISCSWGPVDGNWWDPHDPLHDQVVPLPDATRLAIDWAITNGRNGKGCIITWAAGNGNESVVNDGYASYGKVIAVAACNDRGKKSKYSDFGKAILCAFPSNDMEATKTPGIWTTDRSGTLGYNPGQATKGDAAGNYANNFGGTSSACPGAAGVAALVLARNPSLRWDEVREIFKRSCDKIDQAGGQYDSAGRSKFYGYGRVNAKTAVTLAGSSQPAPAPLTPVPQPTYTAIHTAVQDVSIQDLKVVKLTVEVGDTKPMKAVKIAVDIEHTYIGDLVVRIIPPMTAGLSTVILHNRTGGNAKNLRKTYDQATMPALSTFVSKRPQGTWTLEVEDKEKQDTGILRKFSVEISF